MRASDLIVIPNETSRRCLSRFCSALSEYSNENASVGLWQIADLWGAMRRREFMTLLADSAVGLPRAARAEADGQIRRIGILAPGGPDNPAMVQFLPEFTAELRKLGFSEGSTLIVEGRIDGGTSEAFTAAADLIRSKVDVVVAFGPEIVLKAAVTASQTIPIVMIAVNFDPVATGYVSNIARPTRTQPASSIAHPSWPQSSLRSSLRHCRAISGLPCYGQQLRRSSSTPPNAPRTRCASSCVHIRSNDNHSILTRHSKRSQMMDREWCLSFPAPASPPNVS